MTLITSKRKKEYRWQIGDLITPLEAAQLCGYKSAKQFQDPHRRKSFAYDFTVIRQGKRMFFLRAEVDKYLTQIVEAAKARNRAKRF